MAITTINAVVADVMLVTELNRLLPFNPLAGIPRRTIQLDRRIESGGQNKDSSIDRDFRERVCAVVEDLHRWRFNQGALNYRAKIKTASRGASKALSNGGKC